MNEQKKSKGNIRVVFRHSSPLLKCVIAVMILVSVAALLLIGNAIVTEQERQQQAQMDAAQLEAENRRLTQEIAELGTVESVKRLASLKLGLIDPNDQLFNPNN